MNPLLSLRIDDQHPIPFPEIKDEHYAPALKTSIDKARKNLANLAADTSTPTFANTIEGIEGFKEDLDRVSGVFFNLLSSNTNETMQALAKDISPELADLSNDLLLDDKIFARIKTIYANKEKLGLDLEQLQLLDKTYKVFRRNGALLSKAEKEKLREIDKKSASLAQVFSDNVLKATNEYFLFVDDESAIRDLPASALEDAKKTAQDKDRPDAWAFTLQFPSYFPFLQLCPREDLRKEMWTAYMSKGMKSPFDNRDVLKQIARLRFERAKVLGYKTHAHFVLEERMAESPEKVISFLEEFLQHAKGPAQKDLAELKQAKKAHVGSDTLHPWDVAFYSERIKREKYSLSDDELRPYFKLENVIQGVFDHAQQLFGLQFKARTDVPVYHPDVKAFEVRDDKNQFMGFFYADFFPRDSKRGGAWMTNFLEQGTWGGKKLRPHVSIVCNFTKPTSSQPSLLTLDEVKTLFHEFGHSLHSLLSDCTYASLAGTNVYWDFVELPSQMMENWVTEEEGLAVFARHYETGAKMPKELIQKIKDSSAFQAGMQGVRQVSLSLLDFAWHGQDPGDPTDIEAFERQSIERALFFPHMPGTSTSAAFSHIFAGGYSAGYYSYKWAEVLDADAFEFFKEKGIFSREVADKFRQHVLSRGGTEHPMELYKRFRGREPDPKALLRRDGLLKK